MPINTHATVTILGLLIGLGIGYVTRPFVPLVGMQIPIEVIASPFPADQPFRQQLAVHLGVAAAIGAAAGMAIGMAFNRR